jgi:hypothetical protein
VGIIFHAWSLDIRVLYYPSTLQKLSLYQIMHVHPFKQTMQPCAFKIKPNKLSEHGNDSQQFQQNIFLLLLNLH